MRPALLRTQVSSGGVIYKKSGGNIEVALIIIKKCSNWCLPKGLIDRGETPEQTAVREVAEETGLRGRIINKIGEISYWYYLSEDNAKCRKTVHFYLMEYEGGSTDDHDMEVEKAEWCLIDRAIEKVRYKGERDMLKKAREMLARAGVQFSDVYTDRGC